ncbi:MAG: alkaline phosphatase family protein [Ktedonobacteraceae bacterium]|nr:alkaline phosphatase family protein [Ktedonobacteraceae bacterium]
MKKRWRLIASIGAVAVVLFGATLGLANRVSASSTQANDQRSNTTTPIQHLVVIYQENVSFDHYFGTYPYATNPAGEPAFHARPNTPTVNGLSPALLTNNPNAANPQRLDRSMAMTCDQNHAYTAEQQAYDRGLVDQFVQSASGGHCKDKSIVMDYYDGNTVTAFWNYAQHFAMSDNSFSTTFGPSTPGALNLVAGQTHGATPANFGYPGYPVTSNGTMLNDGDPTYDDCSANGTTIAMAGPNAGDLLNAKHITWGWFEGGFAPSSVVNGKAVCATTHTNIGGAVVTDYIPHHQPFQYYQSTANPHHLPPSSLKMIGKTDQANHQYDLQYFWSAIKEGQMPAVSFLKAPAYQDGHAGYSDPLDEQTFLVNTINKLQKTREWKNTAVVIAYDDSDGWYDHVLGPIVSQSNDPNDALTGPGSCGTAKAGAYQGRCGYGPRQPLLVISPLAKDNFVDHSVTDQSSILRFIEDNWKLGRIGDQSFDVLAGTLNTMFNFHDRDGRHLYLNPTTGEPTGK